MATLVIARMLCSLGSAYFRTQIVENEREAAPMIYPGADLTMLRAIAWYDGCEADAPGSAWRIAAPQNIVDATVIGMQRPFREGREVAVR